MDLVILRGVSSVIPIFLGFLFSAVAASRRAWQIVPLFLAIALSFVPDLYPLAAVPQSVAQRPILNAPFRQAIFLFGPFLWYYVARSIGCRPLLALHALVYPAAVVVYLLGPPGTRIYLPMAVARICWVLLYAAGIVVVLRRRREELKDLVANPSESTLPWLRYLIYWVAGIFVFMAAAGAAGTLYSIPWFLDLGEVLTRTGVTIFLTGCWLRVLGRPRLIGAAVREASDAPARSARKMAHDGPLGPPTTVAMQVRAEGLPDMAGQAAAEPPAPPDSLDLIEQRFARLMASGAYREESLSLYACAQRVGCPPQYLSYVLNHRIGERFSDHVAGYRIREILASLDRGEQRRKTILALAFEAGFQSKSAFYDAFRRTTGTTPRMYLAHHAS